MVAPARGGGLLCWSTCDVVHRSQRRRLSRFPKLRLARRTRVQFLNWALIASAAHDSGRSDLDKDSGKEGITMPVPGVTTRRIRVIRDLTLNLA